MKTIYGLLKVTFILISLLGSSGLKAQCDLAIDKDNTYYFLNEKGNLGFKSVVHHPYRGNSNAGHDVVIRIMIPEFSNVISPPRVSINDVAVDQQYIVVVDSLIKISIDALQRHDHVEIELDCSIKDKLACGYGFHINVESSGSSDVYLGNNSHSIYKLCD